MSGERPHVLQCRGDRMLAIVHLPKTRRRLGVIIIVGGPQYRVGSHRLFVHLARALAAEGFAALRFDYRGLGDSEGVHPGFQHIGPDIAAAVDALMQAAPELDGVVLWGLCDAASAIADYAADDRRVAGAVMLNPWARAEEGYEDVLLKDYYAKRVFSGEFWRKVMRLDIRVLDFPRLAASVIGRKLRRSNRRDVSRGNALARRTVTGLKKFRSPLLLVMSGADLTAKEFDREAAKEPDWPQICRRSAFTRIDLAEADHTFSTAGSKDRLVAETLAWMNGLETAENVTVD